MCKIIVLASMLLASPVLQADMLTPADTVRMAPDFSSRDTQGNAHKLSDYRGKVVIVNFWATWCPPCVKEMPSLQRAWEQLRDDGFQVLGINMGESKADIEAFIALTPVDFPLLLDENMELGPLWSLKGLPTTYIVAPDGRIAFTVLGDKEWDEPQLLEQLRTLSSKNQSTAN